MDNEKIIQVKKLFHDYEDYETKGVYSCDYDELAKEIVKLFATPDVSGSLPPDEELQKVVERIAYEQHGEDQAEDCYAKMGILHEFVKTYVDGGNDR